MKYHKSLEIDIIASNCSSGEREELFTKYKILHSKTFFQEEYAKRKKLFNDDIYLCIVDIISTFKLNSDEIKILVKKDFIDENLIYEITKKMKSLNFLKDEKEYSDKKIIYKKSELF